MIPTEKQLREMEARANASVPGDWIVVDNPQSDFIFVTCAGGLDICKIERGEYAPHLAEFIAHARTDIPALIAALREAQQEITALHHAMGNGNYLTDTQKLELNAEHIALLECDLKKARKNHEAQMMANDRLNLQLTETQKKLDACIASHLKRNVELERMERSEDKARKALRELYNILAAPYTLGGKGMSLHEHQAALAQARAVIGEGEGHDGTDR